MKTKWIVLLTAMASFTLFTLFAYCTKDTPGPAEGGLTATEPTIDLAGTTWKTVLPDNAFIGESMPMYADFTSGNTGKYRLANSQYPFSYNLNGSHGAVNCDFGELSHSFSAIFINNATIIVIDKNTIGIGGRVFTKQ